MADTLTTPGPPTATTTTVVPPTDATAVAPNATETPQTTEPPAPETKPAKKRTPKRGTKAERAAKKAANDAAHFWIVLEAARVVVEILRREGVPCAIFGSLASRMYGAVRCPKVRCRSFLQGHQLDVDILYRTLTS